MAANRSSRRCLTSAMVATPMAPSTALPTKLALAEKHTKPSAGPRFAEWYKRIIREPASGLSVGYHLFRPVPQEQLPMYAEHHTRKRFFLAFWLFVLSAISFLDRTNISIAGLQISSEYGLGNQRLGWIFSAFLIGYAGFQVPAGWLASRFGPRLVITLGVVWWGVATALTTLIPPGISQAVLLLIGIRFALGAGEAVIYPAANQFVARWVPVQERGFVNGLIFAGVGAGSGLTPPLLAWFILHHGWRSAFWFSAVIGVIAGAVWWWAARDTPEEDPTVSPSELNIIRQGIAQDGLLRMPAPHSCHLLAGHPEPARSAGVDHQLLRLWLHRVDILQLVLPVHGAGAWIQSQGQRFVFHAALSIDDHRLPGGRSASATALRVPTGCAWAVAAWLRWRSFLPPFFWCSVQGCKALSLRA